MMRMTKIEKSVVIHAPVQKVYAFASDWRNLKRYFVYVQDVKPRTEKTLGEGAALELRVRFLGLTLTSEWLGTEQMPNVAWAFNAKLMGLWATKRWQFASVDGFTRVTFTMTYDPSPPVIGQLVDVLLIRREWERLYEQSFQTLRQLVEAEMAVP